MTVERSLMLSKLDRNIVWESSDVKGATKLYAMRLSRVVIILFNTGLSRSAFSTYSFRKLVLIVFLWFLCFLLVLCFEFNATICMIIIYVSSTCSVIFSHLTVFKNNQNLII